MHLHLISLSGVGSSGKDTAADFLVANHNFCKIAFADELKRILCRLYPHMTRDHLWGPSMLRGAPIKQYPTNEKTFDNCLECSEDLKYYYDFEDNNPIPYWRCKEHGRTQFFITARHALTRLDCLREMYPNTYIDFTMRDVELIKNGWDYDPYEGILSTFKKYKGIVITDNRWPNGYGGVAVRNVGGVLLRMKRGQGLKGTPGKHSSETFQRDCPDSFFDYVADNREWSLDQLSSFMDKIVKELDSKSK